MAKLNPEVEKIVEKNIAELSNSISFELGFQAAAIITEIADKEGIEWAIAGGLAMYLYGFDRSTKDIDFVANRRLPIEIKRYLGFGGERYEVIIGKRVVPIDWILRKDDYKDFYREALQDAIVIQDWKVLTPEWLVILKYIAGRAKDRIDLLWLLQQKGLVNRKIIRTHLMKVLGRLGAKGFLLGLQREFDIADLSTGKTGDENESYTPDEMDEG
jgi:hypothetical protein